MAEKSFSTHVNQIYLPGDSVALSKTDEISSALIVIGPGLRKYGKQILVTKPGVLRTKASPATYWIDCHHKRVIFFTFTHDEIHFLYFSIMLINIILVCSCPR